MSASVRAVTHASDSAQQRAIGPEVLAALARELGVTSPFALRSG